MQHSINTPWAISEKYKNRYGDIWANLDFIFADKISAELFKTDPMNTNIGELCIYNQRIVLTYKDLLNYSKSSQIACNEAYINGSKSDIFVFRVKSQEFSLQRHELRKLHETLAEASTSALRAYELGLYL